MMMAKLFTMGVGGNFQQKKYPINPIAYLRDHDIDKIFRYVQTHPDMDHMDGIEVLFNEFSPMNLWDTDNEKEMSSISWTGSPYNEADWIFYKNLRDTNPQYNPKRLTRMAGDRGRHWNIRGGDGIQILAPTRDLLDLANRTGDYNNYSYVLLYRTAGRRIIFGGDSHDDTWKYILENHEKDVTDIDLLIAPHHGRRSNRSYEFLDVLRPSLTFFGNARSEHLAYGAWNHRELPFVTNNQANCMVVDTSLNQMNLYVTHEAYARKVNSLTYYSDDFKAWFVRTII